MASKIICKNIEKIVNDKVILRGVNLQAKQGEVVALLGPNGAGKTTTFSILCGMVRPSHGTVRFDSTDITDWPMYKRSRTFSRDKSEINCSKNAFLSVFFILFISSAALILSSTVSP